MNGRSEQHGSPGASRTPRSRRATARSVRVDELPPGLVYEIQNDGWWLCWPCSSCGGTRLPLIGRRDPTPRRLVPSVRPTLLDGGCPSCAARRHRAAPVGCSSSESAPAPAVWYDPTVVDWVVRLEFSDPDGCAILPLGLRWLDARWADIYRRAADIMYAADEFVDPASESTLHLRLPDD